MIGFFLFTVENLSKILERSGIWSKTPAAYCVQGSARMSQKGHHVPTRQLPPLGSYPVCVQKAARPFTRHLIFLTVPYKPGQTPPRHIPICEVHDRTEKVSDFLWATSAVKIC